MRFVLTTLRRVNERGPMAPQVDRAEPMFGVRIMPWASLRAVIGVVSGEPADSVEDCERLYDGDP